MDAFIIVQGTDDMGIVSVLGVRLMSMEAFRGKDELPVNGNGLEISMVRSVYEIFGQASTIVESC